MNRLGLIRVILLCCFLGLPLASQNAEASGSYTGRPPKAPSSEKRQLYLIGKDIINGKTSLSEAGDSSEQKGVLQELQARLPNRAQSKLDLTQYSGKLTELQFKGVQHYLQVRYKLK